MAESPKRRKCKDNPYTLNYIEEKNIYTITFKDVKGHLNKVEVSEEVYRVFDKFELQDIKELNEYDRHIEHSEIFENNLESRALNKNGGFDERGNLYYGPISKVVPNFKYVGNVNLRGKSRSEKLALITQYVNAGYFVTEEVKGAIPGNQHWVAVTGVNGNNVIMVDPASNQTDMWSAYEWSKSSQFNYFKAD